MNILNWNGELGPGDLLGLVTALLAVGVAYYSGLKQAEEARRTERNRMFYEAAAKFESAMIPAHSAVLALAENGTWNQNVADNQYEKAREALIETRLTFQQTSTALDRSAGALVQAFQNLNGAKKNRTSDVKLIRQLTETFFSRYDQYVADKANGPASAQPTRRRGLTRFRQAPRHGGTESGAR
jgi:hypothetical protein